MFSYMFIPVNVLFTQAIYNFVIIGKLYRFITQNQLTFKFFFLSLLIRLDQILANSKVF